MAIPVDDGVSDLFWDEEGFLVERSTGSRVLDHDGQSVLWQDDPNELLPYEGPTIWAFSSYRYDLTPDTAVTIWIEADTLEVAQLIYQRSAGAGLIVLTVNQWQPDNLAQHLRWVGGSEGNLAAIIQEK